MRLLNEFALAATLGGLLSGAAVAAPPGPERGVGQEQNREVWRNLEQGPNRALRQDQQELREADRDYRHDMKHDYWTRYWHWYDTDFRPYYHAKPQYYSYPYQTPYSQHNVTPSDMTYR